MPEKGPVTLREEDLDFTFDASWQVCSQWDREGVYGDLKAQASGSKGVDFVGLRGGALYLIEVKDYRTFEKQSSTRETLTDDLLAWQGVAVAAWTDGRRRLRRISVVAAGPRRGLAGAVGRR